MEIILSLNRTNPVLYPNLLWYISFFIPDYEFKIVLINS